MQNYETIAKKVIINKENRLIQYDDALQHIGTGRSAYVFRIKSTMKAIKVFFPSFIHLAKEETDIYKELHEFTYYPTVYELGLNYIVLDYIEGQTLFECLSCGKNVTSRHMEEIDYALSLPVTKDLNPSDVHLRNIFITCNDEIKIIDVARFRQTKNCRQWRDLKKAYERLYCKRLFPKKIPALYLNIIAFLYKKGNFMYKLLY